MGGIIKQNKVRNSSIELLRIITMIIIIMHHFGIHGVFHMLDKSYNILIVDNLSWQIIFTQIISWGGRMGNTIFILITGYFLINKKINKKKILLLFISMMLYSWIIEIIYFYGLDMPYSIKMIISETIPIYFGYNWFISCYIIFSFFIPFINKFLNNIDKYQYISFLVLTFVLYSILPSFKFNTFMDSSLIFFGFVYSIGGYLRLHFYEQIKETYNGKYLKLFLVQVGIIVVSIIFFDMMAILFSKNILIKLSIPFINILSIPMAITLFLYFLTRKPIYNRFINIIASSILGIYLIHENNLMRNLIWDYIFPNLEYINSDFYILFFVIKVSLIFIICSFIELLRKKYLESVVSKLLDKYWDSYSNKINIIFKTIIFKLIR